MTYRSRLYPWCIVSLLPDLQRLNVAHFRRRNDAEEHIKVLRRKNPTGVYEIVFDPLSEDPVPSIAVGQ